MVGLTMYFLVETFFQFQTLTSFLKATWSCCVYDLEIYFWTYYIWMNKIFLVIEVTLTCSVLEVT